MGWAVLLEILEVISTREGSCWARDTNQVMRIVELWTVSSVDVLGRADAKVHSSSGVGVVVMVDAVGGAEIGGEVRLPRSVVGWCFCWSGTAIGGGWVDCWNWNGDAVLDVLGVSDANGSAFGAGGC